VASRTIRAAAWLKSSRLRPAAGFGCFFAGFFDSRLPESLFPMPQV
jgi:hypothetical protein